MGVKVTVTLPQESVRTDVLAETTLYQAGRLKGDDAFMEELWSLSC